MSETAGCNVKDTISCWFAKLIYNALAMLPHRVCLTLFDFLFASLFLLIPRCRKTGMRNLEIAFPEQTDDWRKIILRKNATEMARLAADAVRLASLDEQWVRDHVSCPILPRYLEALAQQNGKGLLIASGHLGSFELLGHTIGLMGHPLSAVARSFQSPKLDTWWTSLRESRGNKIIGRKGAFKEISSTLSRGRSVAVLFDQNVTRNHAVFVEWLGLPAATTKSLALAALRSEVPIFVASILYRGDDRYTIDAIECNFSHIYRDESLSLDEKVFAITNKLAGEYTRMIRAFPEGWFWIHRRWKTRPEADSAKVYK